MTGSTPTILSVNISAGGIPKQPVAEAVVTRDGLAGDGHDHEKHGTPLQAVCIIDVEDLENLRREGFDVSPGATGENLTVRGLDVDELAVGDRLALSGGVRLEITKRRKPCFVLDAIHPDLKTAIAGRCGAYAKVLREGRVTPGQTVEREETGSAAAREREAAARRHGGVEA